MAKRIPGRHIHKVRSAASLGIEPYELELQSQIRVALERIGCFVVNLSTGQRSFVTPGTPDIFAAHPAWRCFAFIEVKTDDGVRSKVQREWADAVRESGCPILLVHSVLDAVQQFGNLPRGRS